MLNKTTTNLSNPKNVAEIQKRTLNIIKPVQDTLNKCLIAASNTQELHFCVDGALRGLDTKIVRIKEILREYWL